MSIDMSKIGRLALRQEGPNWNAYYAMPDTMKGALFLGSIRLGAVGPDNRKRKDAFMAMMFSIVADIIEEKTGYRPVSQGPQPAPEHERAGNA